METELAPLARGTVSCMSGRVVLVNLATAALIACARDATRGPDSPDRLAPSVASASPYPANSPPTPSALVADEPEPQCGLPTRPVPPALQPSLSWVAPPSARADRAVRTFRVKLRGLMSLERYERGIAGLTRLSRRTRRGSPDPSLILRLGMGYFEYAHFALEQAEHSDDPRVRCEMLAVYERALARSVAAKQA